MGKRHPNLPAWQWRAYPNNHQHPTNLVLHLIAVPLFIVAFLLPSAGRQWTTRQSTSARG